MAIVVNLQEKIRIFLRNKFTEKIKGIKEENVQEKHHFHSFTTIKVTHLQEK